MKDRSLLFKIVLIVLVVLIVSSLCFVKYLNHKTATEELVISVFTVGSQDYAYRLTLYSDDYLECQAGRRFVIELMGEENSYTEFDGFDTNICDNGFSKVKYKNTKKLKTSEIDKLINMVDNIESPKYSYEEYGPVYDARFIQVRYNGESSHYLCAYEDIDELYEELKCISPVEILGPWDGGPLWDTLWF